MKLSKINITSFRNYDEVSVSDFRSINLIHGENGQGKTSFIEAIYYTALTQSFKAKQDQDCVNFSEKENTFFNIDTSYVDKNEQVENVRVYYGRKEGKTLFLNGNREKKYKNHIGFIPIVLIKPDDSKLTFGSPGDRRKFIDILLSQISPVYLDSLIKYKKLIKHKNAILYKQENHSTDLIKTWNDELVKYGSVLIKKRHEIAIDLKEETEVFYQKISNSDQMITIQYQSSLDDFFNIETDFANKLEQVFENEIQQKKSLIGPHRDDFVFKIDHKSVGQYGSQGENKTFLISLKMAELEILKRSIKEKPILLFDDIFSELDDLRVGHLMEMINDVGQIFITSTNKDIFDGNEIRKIHIHNGAVVN